MRSTICSLLFLTSAISGYGQTEDSTERWNDEKSEAIETDSRLRGNDKKKLYMREFDPNFAHTVYFWFKNPDNAEDRKTFETSLQKFLDNSAYAKTSFIGTPPQASRDVVDGSFTYSLIVTFESAEAQQAYQDEAPHNTFIEESSSLWSKVIVYDSKGIN